MYVYTYTTVRYYRWTHIYLMQIERANYVFDIEKKKKIIYNSAENMEQSNGKIYLREFFLSLYFVKYG